MTRLSEKTWKDTHSTITQKHGEKYGNLIAYIYFKSELKHTNKQLNASQIKNVLFFCGPRYNEISACP